MPRYVDVDRYLVDEFCFNFDNCCSSEDCFACWARRHTEEVAPVIHAKWEDIYEERDALNHDLMYVGCSNCRKPIMYNRYGKESYEEYCPHCGARMDCGEL